MGVRKREAAEKRKELIKTTAIARNVQVPTSPRKTRVVADKICGGCQMVRYCSPECQKADWASHKKICARFKSATEIEKYIDNFKFDDLEILIHLNEAWLGFVDFDWAELCRIGEEERSKRKNV